MATKAHLEGNKRYLETLDSVTIRMPKGHRGEIKAAADGLGLSLNAYIVGAIDRRMAEGEPRENI